MPKTYDIRRIVSSAAGGGGGGYEIVGLKDIAGDQLNPPNKELQQQILNLTSVNNEILQELKTQTDLLRSLND